MALNRHAAPRHIRFDWRAQTVRDDLSHRDADLARRSYALRDLWRDEDVGDTSRALEADVGGQDVLLLRLTPAR